MLHASSDSIQLSWSSPDVLNWNGIITGYTAQIVHIPSMELVQFEIGFENNSQKFLAKGNGFNNFIEQTKLHRCMFLNIRSEALLELFYSTCCFFNVWRRKLFQKHHHSDRGRW